MFGFWIPDSGFRLLGLAHYTRKYTQYTTSNVHQDNFNHSCLDSLFLFGIIHSYSHFQETVSQFGICYFAGLTLRCFDLFHRISDSTFTASKPIACFGRTTFATRVVVQRSRNISSCAIRIFRNSCLFGDVPYINICSASIQWSSYSKRYRKKCNNNIFLRQQNRQR